MCPKCMRHVKLELVRRASSKGGTYNRFMDEWRCADCGTVSKYADLRWNDAQEREAVVEARRERCRRWHLEHREERLAKSRAYWKARGPEQNAKARIKYRTDEEYRNRKLEAGKRWRLENPERYRETQRAWERTNREKVMLSKKRSRLNAYRRELETKKDAE